MNFLNVAICFGVLGFNCVGDLVVYNDMDVLENGMVVLMGHTFVGGNRVESSLACFLEDNPSYLPLVG